MLADSGVVPRVDVHALPPVDGGHVSRKVYLLHFVIANF